MSPGVSIFLEAALGRLDHVIAGAIADRRPGLKESVSSLRHIGPFVAVERHAEDDLLWFDPSRQVRLHGSIRIVGRIRITLCLVERRDQASRIFPWSVEVVIHQVEKGKRLLHLLEVDVLVGPAAGRGGDRKRHAFVNGVQLCAEFG